MDKAQFLAVETKVGTLAIFPGDTEKDITLAKQMNKRIVRSCDTNEEAMRLVGELTDKAVAAWFRK